MGNSVPFLSFFECFSKLLPLCWTSKLSCMACKRLPWSVSLASFQIPPFRPHICTCTPPPYVRTQKKEVKLTKEEGVMMRKRWKLECRICDLQFFIHAIVYMMIETLPAFDTLHAENCSHAPRWSSICESRMNDFFFPCRDLGDIGKSMQLVESAVGKSINLQCMSYIQLKNM